jgi:putative two-component system response regulator
MTERYIESLVRSAPLHDIGKVGIPDQILMKPGPLTTEEREVMQTHTILGCEAISSAEKDIDRSVAFLSNVKEIVRWHHECWDGTGYPDGLRGEEIPLSARIMAIADVFDALITKRVYKDALSFPDVKAIIAGERGKQFDPDIVDTFLHHWDAFKTIAIEGAAC